MKYKKNQTVKWKWGQGIAEGKVQQSFTREVSRTISGSKITRKGSKENPAYLIKQEDGSTVLKLESELEL